MREQTLMDFRAAVRRVLASHLRLEAQELVLITDAVAGCAIPAIDREVEAIVQATGLVLEEVLEAA